MKMTPILALAAALLTAGLTSGCTTTRTTTTTNPDGTTNTVVVKVPDPVKTEKVKAVAESVSTLVLRRALQRFPKEADEIARYARAVGAVFCEMQATKKFNPESLEAGIAAIALPLITDEKVAAYVADARDVLKVTYRVFYADRFDAELPADKWPAVIADIFCNSIDRGLKDSGRAGVK